jgi:chromosome segregation ATPase
VERNILDVLETRIDDALQVITEMHRRQYTLMEELKEVKVKLAESERHVETLQRALEEQKIKSDEAIVQKYKETEEKLRTRIQSMLAKLDELKVLEGR